MWKSTVRAAARRGHTVIQEPRIHKVCGLCFGHGGRIIWRVPRNDNTVLKMEMEMMGDDGYGWEWEWV